MRPLIGIVKRQYKVLKVPRVHSNRWVSIIKVPFGLGVFSFFAVHLNSRNQIVGRGGQKQIFDAVFNLKCPFLKVVMWHIDAIKVFETKKTCYCVKKPLNNFVSSEKGCNFALAFGKIRGHDRKSIIDRLEQRRERQGSAPRPHYIIYVVWDSGAMNTSSERQLLYLKRDGPGRTDKDSISP